jgi:hypothetical protein
VKEREFLGSRFGYEVVAEDLAGQIVAVFARETLRRAVEFGFDVGIVVWCLYSEAAVL